MRLTDDVVVYTYWNFHHATTTVCASRRCSTRTRGSTRTTYSKNKLIRKLQVDSLGPDVKIVDPGSVEDGDELEPEFIRQRSKESPAGVDPELISSPGETAHVPR